MKELKKNILTFGSYLDVMKLNDYSNMKHTEWYCPFCKHSEYTLLDSFHGEVFCENCGAVLHEIHTRKSIVKIIEEARKKEPWWYSKKED